MTDDLIIEELLDSRIVEKRLEGLAAIVAGKKINTQVIRRTRQLLQDEDESIQIGAISAYPYLGISDEEVVEDIAKLILSPITTKYVKKDAFILLGDHYFSMASDFLSVCAIHSDPVVRLGAIRTIAKWSPKPPSSNLLHVLISAVADPDDDVSSEATKFVVASKLRDDEFMSHFHQSPDDGMRRAFAIATVIFRSQLDHPQHPEHNGSSFPHDRRGIEALSSILSDACGTYREIFQHGDPDLLVKVARQLDKMPTIVGVFRDQLLALLSCSDNDSVIESFIGLIDNVSSGPQISDILTKHIRSSSAIVRLAVILSVHFPTHPGQELLHGLVSGLTFPSDEVSAAAHQRLVSLGARAKSAIPVIEDLIRNDRNSAREKEWKRLIRKLEK